MSEPSVTDWIQSIGVLLGIPVGIWSIISLFRKDLEKEKRIESLSKIATSQNNVVQKLSEQVEQLTIQTSQFQQQISIMIEANKILEKQFELQNEVFLHEKGIDEKKFELERKKRIAEIKPLFYWRDPISSHSEFTVYLENRGGNAKNVRLIEKETRFVWFKLLPQNMEKETSDYFAIIGCPKSDVTYFTGHNVTFELNIEFEDIDGNTYEQNLKRLNTGVYIIDESKLK